MTALHIVCPHCDGVNRVDSERLSVAKCGKCQASLFSAEPLSLDAKRFHSHLSRSEVPLVVDFWASWCGPCKMMAPIFSEAAKLLEPRARLIKVDTEQSQQLAAQYAIRSIPSLLIFKGGKEIARQAGAMDLPQLQAWVNQHL